MGCTADFGGEVSLDSRRTISVGFEQPSRIELANGKTVWSVGDLISLFDHTTANQQWRFTGATGERMAQLEQVTDNESTQVISDMVLVYPYSEDNTIIDKENLIVEMFMPAEQSYAADSFGVGSSPMVAIGDGESFMLKNVCGWLCVSFTGDGEAVDRVVLKGNDNEQVAGSMAVDPSNGLVTLVSQHGIPEDDMSVGGTLIFDDKIIREVVLNCADAVVKLSAEPTTFYIALPPQTFSYGVTVDVVLDDGTMMTKSTDNTLTISRNAIQPMESVEYVGNTVLYYTTTDGNVVTPYDTKAFGVDIISNEYSDGCGKITFDGVVTTLGTNLFYNNATLESITIPETVTEIAATAFRTATALKQFKGKGASADGRSVVFDDTLVAVACAGTSEFTLPDGVKKMNGYLFYQQKNIEKVNLPEGLTEIGSYAFYQCSALTTINIPESITILGESMFYECSALKGITIPASITEIPQYMFDKCTSLASVTLNEGLEIIGERAFMYCSALEEVVLPQSVTKLATRAFGNCTNLKKINLPNGLKQIDNRAFNKDSSLESITIPASVEIIGLESFSGCTSLKNVYFDAINPPSISLGIISCDDVKVYVYEQSIEAYKAAIGESRYTYEVLSNGKTADADQTVTLRYTTTDGSMIDLSKFALKSHSYIDGMGEAVIYGTILSVGDMFYNLSTLKSIELPEGVAALEQSAFRRCVNLESVTLPSTITRVESGAFERCISLKQFVGDMVSADGRAIVIDGYLRGVASAGATHYTIPEGVKVVGEYAFAYTTIESVIIPYGVTEIEPSAFYSCSNLVSVNIADSVTTIGLDAFRENDNLTSVTIGRGVDTIAGSAFKNCANLKEVYCRPITPPALIENTAFGGNADGRKIYVPAESVDAYKTADVWCDFADCIVGYHF